MAILKDLIVHGSSRFLNKIYASEIQTPLIEAEAGVFKKLKADDATVVGLLDVKGQLHTNSWSNSNIATIDGSFYITPTIGSASGIVTITASTLAFSGTNYAVSSLYLGDGSSITWPQYSKVLVTGQILSNGEWIPLGTLLGQLSSTATAASISINNIKDNKNQTSNVLATLVSNGTTSSSYRNLKVSLYQRASSSTAFYPLGIYMTATGTNGRTFLDIYGGVEALSNSNNYGGFAEPNVRIGNLQGLPNVGGQTPSGWGIYTDNGYFKGIIAADKGYIGSGSKYWVIANEEDVSNVENSRSYIYNGKISYNDTTNDGVYLGTDGIGLGKGNFYVTKAGSLTAKSGSIGGWQLDANSFHTGNWGNDNSALICTGTGGSKSIGGSESINNWVFTAGANFGVTKSGALYASSANISGKVIATSGSIGGVNIVDGNLDVSSISIGSLKGAKDFSSDNLLKDVYASSLTKENAQWDRYLSDASNSTITGEFIAEANLPDPNATHFYRITDSSATTKGRALCFYSDGTPPFKDGHTYKIGCWVRKHAGQPRIHLLIGSTGSSLTPSNNRVITKEDWEWIEIVKTFGDTDPNKTTQSNTYKRLYLYFYNNNVAGSSLDMCGFKMEEVQVNSGTARNLLLGTEKLTNWGTVNGATISNGVAIFPTITANSWREIYPAKNFKYELIRNQNVISSIKVRAENGKKCCLNFCVGVESTETAYTRQKYFNQFIYFTGTGDWQTICTSAFIEDSIFVSGSGTPNYNNCWITVRIGAVNTYQNGFEAKEPQMCLGTTATSWSRAPEDVDETINNIEIGGRNLLKNSNVENTSLINSAIGGTATRTIPSGTVITLSVQVDADDVVWKSSGNRRIGVASSITKDGGGTQYIEAWAAMTGYTSTGVDKTFDTSFHGRVKSTYTLQGELPLDKVFTLYIQNITSGTVSVSNPKLEIGNKATDWTPAPEDVDETIDNIQVGGRNLIHNSANFNKWPVQNDGANGDIWYRSLSGRTENANVRPRTWIGTGNLADYYNKTLIVSFEIMSPDWSAINEGESYTELNGLAIQLETADGVPYSTIGNTGRYFFKRLGDTNYFKVDSDLVNGKWVKVTSVPLTINDSFWTSSTSLIDGYPTFSFSFLLRRNGTISFRKPKIEIGNKATDWTLAPEDTQENINNVSTIANTALNQSVEYIVGTQTAATGSWTGKTNDSTLITGKTIAYKLPYAGSGNASLNLTLANGTTTGAKAVYLNTTRVTTHFGAGSVIQMTYNGTDWRVTSIPNSNTIGTLGATKLIAGTNASNASATTVYRYTLIMKKTTGNNPTWVSLVTSSSNSTSKTRYTGGLYPDKIFYMSTNVSSSPYGYNTGASIGDSYAALGFDLRYSTNCGSTLVIGKPVYLVGEINSLDGLFYLDSTWWTQTEPTIEDGKTYIYLGNAYSTTNVYLVEKNPLMRYYRGAFRTEEQIAGMTATSYITYVDAANGIKIHNYNNIADYIQINSDAISMYRRDTQQPQVPIETLRIQSDNIRIGKIGTGKRNVFITDSAVLIRNNTTTLASYGDSIVLGNEDSLSQITLSQTGVVFTPKTIANSTESAGTFKYIVNESGHSYTLVEESASNQNTGTATADPLRLNNNTYYSNTESFSDVILAKVNNEFWVLGKIGETETSVVVQTIGTDSETWNYNSTPVTKTTITYATMEEIQETTVEREDSSEETESVIVQVNYQITKVESWEKWNVTSGTISGNYIYSGYIKKDPSDETNQSLYSVSYQRKISTSQSSTGTTLNVNVSTDITTSLSFRQMTDFYENKNLDYITTEPDFSILFGKDVWTNSPYSYILGGEKNVIKTNSTIPALYSTIVGGYQNGYFYNKHASTPSLEDTLYKMGIECFIGNGYGNSVQSNLSSIVGGQYNAIYDGESFSVIGGGYNNSIQTWYDDAIPGNTNFYNAPYQFLGGGKDNSSRSDYGVLVGGYNNINLGKYSVISGGASNKTVGQYSVITGGNNNTVLGENGYAHGYLNIVQGNNQTVFGKANIPDSTSLFIIGNGTSNSNRSNALTVNQSGDLTIARNFNLHANTAITLAQKEDYPVYPDSAPKTNRIYASRWADTMNNYYHVQGYHAFYANGNGTFYIEPSRVISMVPFYAPNHLEWITNTNNISRENVIYYGTPKTGVYPSSTVNQPVTDGWFYYKQFAGQSTYNIILGSHMNTSNPTLYIRSRYRTGSTYSWTNWVQFITSSYSALTITRVISTTYLSADDFARIKAYKKNGMLYLDFNTLFNGSNYSVNNFTTIARISGWNAIADACVQIPCQNDSTKILSLTVATNGDIKVYSTSAIHGWYRASICVPYNT